MKAQRLPERRPEGRKPDSRFGATRIVGEFKGLGLATNRIHMFNINCQLKFQPLQSRTILLTTSRLPTWTKWDMELFNLHLPSWTKWDMELSNHQNCQQLMIQMYSMTQQTVSTTAKTTFARRAKNVCFHFPFSSLIVSFELGDDVFPYTAVVDQS